MSKIISDLAQVSAGYAFRGKIVNEVDGAVKAIQMRDISRDKGINWQTVVNTNVPLKANKINVGSYLKPSDIIFTARGNNNYAYEITECPSMAVLSPHLFRIRIRDTSMISPAFLAWQINQKPAQTYFTKNTEGSSIVGIRRKILDGLPIFLPSMIEQNKITNIIHCWEKERDVLNSLKENHQNMMDSIAANILQEDK